jgi:hypothetical protein
VATSTPAERRGQQDGDSRNVKDAHRLFPERREQ